MVMAFREARPLPQSSPCVLSKTALGILGQLRVRTGFRVHWSDLQKACCSCGWGRTGSTGEWGEWGELTSRRRWVSGLRRLQVPACTSLFIRLSTVLWCQPRGLGVFS